MRVGGRCFSRRSTFALTLCSRFLQAIKNLPTLARVLRKETTAPLGSSHRPPLIASIVRLRPRFALAAPSRTQPSSSSGDVFLMLPPTPGAAKPLNGQGGQLRTCSPAPNSVLFVLRRPRQSVQSIHWSISRDEKHEKKVTRKANGRCALNRFLENCAFRSRHPLSTLTPLLSPSPREQKEKQKNLEPQSLSALRFLPPRSLKRDTER